MKTLQICFAAGCIGGFANSFAIWLFGKLGITALVGVSISPVFTPEWLYPRIVWAGIWGLLFIIPLFKKRIILKGTILSLFPTVIQLFVVFPFKAQKGLAGLDLGSYTPVFVILFNWIWGVVTAFFAKPVKEKR